MEAESNKVSKKTAIFCTAWRIGVHLACPGFLVEKKRERLMKFSAFEPLADGGYVVGSIERVT